MSRAAAVMMLALSLTLGVVLAGCTDSKGVGTNAYPIGNGAAAEVPVSKRGEPVALSGTTLQGSRLDVATLRGQIVVLNVWGSWCPPCRKEAPALVEAAASLKSKRVAFVGINTQDPDPSQALAYERTYGVTYPSLVDDGGKLLLALQRAVPPDAIPSTLVLDPQGRVAARFSGAIPLRTLEDLVADVSAT